MKHFKDIIFDVDGVLLDSMSIWANCANRYLAEVHGIDAPSELDQQCATMSLLEAGVYIKELFPQICMSEKELADGVTQFIRKKYWKGTRVCRIMITEQEQKDGVLIKEIIREYAAAD